MGRVVKNCCVSRTRRFGRMQSTHEDRKSGRTGSSKSRMWFTILRGSYEIWKRIHVVSTCACPWGKTPCSNNGLRHKLQCSSGNLKSTKHKQPKVPAVDFTKAHVSTGFTIYEKGHLLMNFTILTFGFRLGDQR